MGLTLVLVCGLPGAGKSTLAAKLVAESTNGRFECERITFDDLFGQWRVQADAAFDPRQWKASQGEMVSRVRARFALWRRQQSTGDQEHSQQVLLVDDNFPYRSQRKRFFQLAADGGVGFGVLYVNTPVDLCKARNATRRGASGAGLSLEHVPEDVFERMAQAFEPPDPRRNTWERNTRQLFGPGSDANAPASPEDMLPVAKAALASIVAEAMGALVRQRQDQAVADRKMAQQSHDQARAQADVAHLVDLQLRQWISNELRGLSNASGKAKHAQVLNQSRKTFLGELKALHASFRSPGKGKEGDAIGTGSDAPNGELKRLLLQLDASRSESKSSDESVLQPVDALVALFHSQYGGCDLSYLRLEDA